MKDWHKATASVVTAVLAMSVLAMPVSATQVDLCVNVYGGHQVAFGNAVCNTITIFGDDNDACAIGGDGMTATPPPPSATATPSHATAIPPWSILTTTTPPLSLVTATSPVSSARQLCHRPVRQ